MKCREILELCDLDVKWVIRVKTTGKVYCGEVEWLIDSGEIAEFGDLPISSIVTGDDGGIDIIL